MAPKILIMGKSLHFPARGLADRVGKLVWAQKECEDLLSPVAEIVVSRLHS